MKTINDMLDGLRAAVGRTEKESAERAADIRRRIEAGETTGDPILDFLAWLWPASQDAALPHYRALAERLRGKKGEYVLMIERNEEQIGGCMPSLGPPVHETFSLGLLNDDRLLLERVDGGRLSLPTTRHAVQGGSPFRRDGLHDGGLRPRYFDTLFWHKTGEPMAFRHRDGGGCFGHSGMSADFCLGAEREAPMTELEFHIGNAEIDAWCRRGAMHFPKETPNERRCELIAGLARPLGATGNSIRAVAESKDARRKKVLIDLAKNADGLKTAFEELNGEPYPSDPAGLVGRIRTARAEIRRLLDEAEDLGSDDSIVKRLRAAHPRRPAK